MDTHTGRQRSRLHKHFSTLLESVNNVKKMYRLAKNTLIVISRRKNIMYPQFFWDLANEELKQVLPFL